MTKVEPKLRKNELLKFCKIHTKYKLKDGTPLLSASHVSSNWGGGGEFLNRWNYRMGLEGYDLDDYMHLVQRIGKLAHQILFDEFNGVKTDFHAYSQLEKEYAENSILSYYAWAKDYKMEPILLETPLVSKDHLFGGTLDFYGKVNGVLELIDYKTGSGIYPTHRLQVSAYKQLVIENKYPVEKVRILNIPRTPDENFIEEIVSDTDSYFEQFLYVLEASYIARARGDSLKKKIKGR